MAVTAPEHGDDGALVRAVQAGDVDAFAALFRRHYPDVRRACARRVLDPGEADELAQAAFVRALERIDQCTGERRFGAWVHVIARSLCMDAFRARAWVEPCEDPLAGRHDHRANEPEESVLDRERAAQVQQALASLPDRQRRAVIARDWDGLRPGEIADHLGLSVGAVDSLLLRARRRLARSYRRLAGEGGRVAGILPVRSAAATIGAAVVFAPGAVSAGTAAAAAAVQDTARKAAGGVVAAIVSMTATLGAAEPAPQTPAPRPPAAVVTVVTQPAGQQLAPPTATTSAVTSPPVPDEVAPATVPPTTPLGSAPVHSAATSPTTAVPPATPPTTVAKAPPPPTVPPAAVLDADVPPVLPATPEPTEEEAPADPPPSPAVDVELPPLPGVPELPLPTVRLP